MRCISLPGGVIVREAGLPGNPLRVIAGSVSEFVYQPQWWERRLLHRSLESKVKAAVRRVRARAKRQKPFADELRHTLARLAEEQF